MTTGIWPGRLVRFELAMVAALAFSLPACESAAWGRSRDAIQADWNQAETQLDDELNGGKLFATAETRKAGARAALETINRVLALNQEEFQAGIMAAFGVSEASSYMRIRRLALDDPSAQSEQARAFAIGGEDAELATAIAAAAEYLDAAQDEQAQLAAIDHLKPAMKPFGPGRLNVGLNSQIATYPLDDLPELFATDNPPATEAVANRLAEFFRNSNNPRWQTDASKIMTFLALRLHLINRPLTIEGTLVDGSKFSTAKWQGKVIFVDFWGTWCPPCVAELPEVAKTYTAYHGEGLEVLSMSADEDGDKLKAFLARNKTLVWPQMFDFAHPGPAAMSETYGAGPYPSIFLIDRKGILRYTYAHSHPYEQLDAEIAKLLAEAP